MPSYFGHPVGSTYFGDGSALPGGSSPAPSGTVSAQAIAGQVLTISGTATDATNASLSLVPAVTPNGAVAIGPIAAVVTAGAWSFSVPGVAPGSYAAPVVLLTGPGGVSGPAGVPFELLGIDGQPIALIAPPAPPPPTTTAPSITLQPTAVQAAVGQLVTLTSIATGTPAPTPQWQRSNDNGITWAAITGATTHSYATTAQVQDDGALFRVVWTNSVGGSTSASARLTIAQAAVEPVTLWLDMVPEFIMDLPDCPHPVIVRELRRASFDFYDKLLTWRSAELDIGLTMPGRADYAVPLPGAAMLAGITSLTVGQDEADVSQRQDAARGLRASAVEPDLVRIAPVPRPGLPLRGVVAYRPSASAAGLPSTLWRQHKNALIALALSRLLDQRGKPWADPAYAAKQAAVYRTESQLAMAAAGVRSTRARLRVRPAD